MPKLDHHLWSLQDSKKEELLNALFDGFMTFTEVEEESGKLMTVATTKQTFMKEVEIETWEEAETLIPHFANKDVLEKFHVQKGKPLPKSFKVW